MIADAAEIKKGEYVIEVGPGEGVLTKELLDRGARVVAIEKDARLIPVLHETFAEEIKNQKLFVHEADALHFDMSKCLPKIKEYKVVANIPYYITGALLKKFLTEKIQPGTLVFLIQKEVAERIARSVKESILSLSVKAYGTPTYVKTVPRGAFSPPPTVDSAILLIKNISRNNFDNAEHEKMFFELVRAGFAQKRKLLKRNVEPILGKEVPSSMEKAGIPTNARAEDVKIECWLALAHHF